MSDDSVSQWIAQLADGDEAAAERIWSGYFDRLLHVARSKLRGARRRAADEEDVVLDKKWGGVHFRRSIGQSRQGAS